MECNILSSTKCDEVTNQFSKKKYHLEFQKFNQKCDRLDDFYLHVIKIQQYKSLSFVLRLILTLCYGQTAVGRCFSISNNILTQNMNAGKYEMLSNKLDTASIEVNKSLLKAAGSALRK